MPASSGSAWGSEVSRETASRGGAEGPGMDAGPATAGNEVSRETCALRSAADPPLCAGASRRAVAGGAVPAADDAGRVPAEATATVASWPPSHPGSVSRETRAPSGETRAPPAGPVSRETGKSLGVRNASSAGPLEPPRGSRGQPSPPSGTPNVSSGQPSPEGAPLDDVMGCLSGSNRRTAGRMAATAGGDRATARCKWVGARRALNHPGAKQWGTCVRNAQPTRCRPLPGNRPVDGVRRRQVAARASGGRGPP